jgi:GDPmannose 4,6-dehydratase
LQGANLNKLKYLNLADKVDIVECDLTDLSQLIKLFLKYEPHEVYNLAAQSSVALSFQQPIGTIQFNINSVFNILEAIRLVHSNARFYQASTSEMYGKIDQLPITEESRFYPLSPYAISKVAAHYATINYRESYNIYSCCGILFNHESFLRGDNFFVKKIIKGALNIKSGKQSVIEVGNLDIRRDFGWSEKYVEAMWLLLQQPEPHDYIISSGKSIGLREIVEYVFARIGVDINCVQVNPDLFRPTDIEDIYGCSNKVKEELKWEYDLDFFAVLDILIKEEKANDGKQ